MSCIALPFKHASILSQYEYIQPLYGPPSRISYPYLAAFGGNIFSLSIAIWQLLDSQLLVLASWTAGMAFNLLNLCSYLLHGGLRSVRLAAEFELAQLLACFGCLMAFRGGTPVGALTQIDIMYVVAASWQPYCFNSQLAWHCLGNSPHLIAF